MGENLQFAPSTGSTWCYKDSIANCGKFGRLYDYATAETACMEGWHLPTNVEWSQLASDAGANLKSTQWNTNSIPSSDSYKFSAIAAPFLDSLPQFQNLDNAFWWAATPSATGANRDIRWMAGGSASLGSSSRLMSYGLSVRCIQD
jgi:uncharacterized protein (TIGR02145 family)